MESLHSSTLCSRGLCLHDASPHPRWVPGHDRIRWDAPGDYASGSHHGILADRDVGQDGGAGPDGGPALNQGGFDLPVLLGLQGTASRGARVNIVDERHPLPYEDVIL